MESLKRGILDALFPPHCVGCGKAGAWICPKCESALPRHLPPFCSLCAKPLSGGSPYRRRKDCASPASDTRSGLCSRCASSPLAIEGIRSVFAFEGVAREGILRLKYRGLRALAEPLGSYLGSYFRAEPLPVDALVPVPLHEKRLRERGYNQSALLAREVAKTTGLKVLEKALVRIKDTPSQAMSTGVEERRQNVRGAFQAVEGEVHGLRLLVIDDVCTTGSTLEGCSLALRKAGAKSVWGLTLAREV